MKTFIRSFLFFFLTFPCVAQNQETPAKIKFYTQKAQNYLDKEKALSGYYSIDESGISMFASLAEKGKHKSEFFISWIEFDNFQNFLKSSTSEKIKEVYRSGNYNSESGLKYIISTENEPKDIQVAISPLKLKNKKIAIDPGHIANNFEIGDLEKKHLKIKGDKVNGIHDSIEIAEGILTFATAELLKKKLENDGAIVFLTRTANKTSFGKTFAQWKKDDLKRVVDSLFKIGELKASQKQYFLSSKANDRDLFRVIFRDLELAKRVELINNFKPDYTVVIHFNVDETNLNWEKTTNKNFNMAFVGGAFMRNDLSNKEKRFEFLRLLITDDLEKSIELSTSVINCFEKELKVPTATIKDAKYLSEGCLPTNANGVYCRNLQLPRYIHSPVVYGETLYQDNINECKLLNEESDKTKNKRIQQIADAYYNGISKYISTFSTK